SGESAPEAAVDDAGARQAVNLLKRVDRIAHPAVEGRSGRRRVVQGSQPPPEIRDGRTTDAVRESRQQDSGAERSRDAAIPLGGDGLDADGVVRDPARVELDPHAARERAIDDGPGTAS